MKPRIDNKYVATGRAKCRCCGKKIEKGLTCARVTGWRMSGQCHKNCDRVADFIEQVVGE